MKETLLFRNVQHIPRIWGVTYIKLFGSLGLGLFLTTVGFVFTNRATAAHKLLVIGGGVVITGDEAGLQSNKLGAAVLKVAERYGSRVLFVGDTQQIAVSEQRTIDLSVGDRILIRRNYRPAGVVNGEVLTVSCIDPDLRIHTKEGAILPPNFRDFCHGYVVTSHKAQGRTHDSVILAAAEVDAKAAC